MKKKVWKGLQRSGMKKYVMDGTHEAHGAFVLRDARATPRHRRVVLLVFANTAAVRSVARQNQSNALVDVG
jgi:hypothetical protein